jgi:hypothetical protein
MLVDRAVGNKLDQQPKRGAEKRRECLGTLLTGAHGEIAVLH